MGLDSMLRRDVTSSCPILIAEHEASLSGRWLSTMCRMALLECWIVRHNGMTFLFLKCLRVVRQWMSTCHPMWDWVAVSHYCKKKRKGRKKKNIWELDMVVAVCNPSSWESEAGVLLSLVPALATEQEAWNDSSVRSSSQDCITGSWRPGVSQELGLFVALFVSLVCLSLSSEWLHHPTGWSEMPSSVCFLRKSY